MTTTADEIVPSLEPTTIAEWDVRDLIFGDLSAGLAFATREEARRLLDRVVLSLPRLSPIRSLVGHAAEHAVPARQHPGIDSGRFDFHLMELPVSISVPAGRKLTRLRLGLSAEAVGELFTAYVIWRGPQQVPLKVSASLLGELHGAGGSHGPGRGALRKAQFRSFSQYYAIPS